MIYNSELHLKGHDVFLELYRLTTDFVILFPMNSSIDYVYDGTCWFRTILFSIVLAGTFDI